MNRIIEVNLSLLESGEWRVSIVKEFGGNPHCQHTFTESGGYQIHRALDIAREMVTLSPANLSDVEED